MRQTMTGKQLALLAGAAGATVWLARRLTSGYDLRGKSVLITGGSRGLGMILARHVLHHGAQVAICARDPDELGRAAVDLSNHGDAILTVPCDLTELGQVRDMLQAVRTHFGQINVLINNAGTISVGPVETMTLDDFHEAMRNNFWSAVHTILEVLPEMRQRGEGHIVNITSIGGKLSVPHLLPYDASKFALVGLSEGLRAELAKHGIVVTTVCPGLMRTGSPRNAMFKGQHQAEYAWFSIGDSLPVFSMDADRAARQIIRAFRRGDAETVLTLPAQCASIFHGVFPGLTCDILGLDNRFLPGAREGDLEKIPGKACASDWSPSWLTKLSNEAAARNNELEARSEGNGWQTRSGPGGHSMRRF
jgi:NAD(P)-dependent dehydrogenase (short-subunit alcohol dehydrogenase family)